MREPISLKEILAVLVKRGCGILLTAVVLAVALGGYQVKKQIDLSKLPENSPEQIEEEYQSALADYTKQKLKLEEDLEKAEQTLERQKDYVDNSLLMKFDPYHLFKNVTVLSIEMQEYTDGVTLTDQSEDRYVRMLSQIQNYYKTNWNVADLPRELNTYGITGIEEKYLRELISVEYTDTMIIITISGETAEDAQNIANAVSQWFMQLDASESTEVHAHKLSEMTNVTKAQIDEVLIEHQRIHLANEEQLEASIDELKDEQEVLVAPARRAGYSRGEILKSGIKWAILGAIAGGVLSCGWILVVFVFRSKIESSRQMEQVLGVPFLGSVAKRGNIWKRLAEFMLAERTWADPAQAEEYLAESFRAVANAPEQTVILTTLTGKTVDLAAVEKAVGTVSGKVVCVPDAERNPQTAKLLQECKSVVLAERVGVSELPKMLSVMEQAKRMDATVVGFVIV